MKKCHYLRDCCSIQMANAAEILAWGFSGDYQPEKISSDHAGLETLYSSPYFS